MPGALKKPDIIYPAKSHSTQAQHAQKSKYTQDLYIFYYTVIINSGT
jgi:hypothetical protein